MEQKEINTNYIFFAGDPSNFSLTKREDDKDIVLSINGDINKSFVLRNGRLLDFIDDSIGRCKLLSHSIDQYADKITIRGK